MTVEAGWAGWLAGWRGFPHRLCPHPSPLHSAHCTLLVAHYPLLTKDVKNRCRPAIHSLSVCHLIVVLCSWSSSLLLALFSTLLCRSQPCFRRLVFVPAKRCRFQRSPDSHHQRGGLSGQYPDPALAPVRVTNSYPTMTNRVFSFRRPRAYCSGRIEFVGYLRLDK